MLSALLVETREQVILLEEDGREHAEELRDLAKQGLIVCEVCSQPVIVRAGDERIWHFAHKTKENCPKAQESLEIVACRALLFQWLREKFKDRVRLEKVLEHSGLPRPVDCWVELEDGRRFAWWLVASQLKPELRGSLKHRFRSLNARGQFIFASRMLHRDEADPRDVILSATERELVFHSEYDALYGGLGGSVHYLDYKKGLLTTYRALLPVHPPQQYRGSLLQRPLPEMLAHPRTGEFVHPGEHERLRRHQEAEHRRQEVERKREEAERRRQEELQQRWQAAAARRQAAERQRRIDFQRRCDEEAEQRKEAERRRQEDERQRVAEARALEQRPEDELRVEREARYGRSLELQETTPTGPAGASAGMKDDPRGSGQASRSLISVLSPEGTCRECGIVTRDWVMYDGATGQCQCRRCAYKGRAR